MDRIDSEMDPDDIDSLAECAPYLKALANDKTFIVRALNSRISRVLENSGGPAQSGQSVFLGEGKNYYLRMNMWPSVDSVKKGGLYHDNFSYHVAHDHNYNFLTVACRGPGYETELYHYDVSKIQGFVGESVDLEFIATKRFREGEVMLYRANEDAHVQIPPNELSVTINIMVTGPEDYLRDQFGFDTTTRKITSVFSYTNSASRAFFVEMAGHIGDAQTQQLLAELSLSHKCRRTRLAAFGSLASLTPSRAPEVWQTACADPDALVSKIARNRLASIAVSDSGSE